MYDTYGSIHFTVDWCSLIDLKAYFKEFCFPIFAQKVTIFKIECIWCPGSSMVLDSIESRS